LAELDRLDPELDIREIDDLLVPDAAADVCAARYAAPREGRDEQVGTLAPLRPFSMPSQPFPPGGPDAYRPPRREGLNHHGRCPLGGTS